MLLLPLSSQLIPWIVLLEDLDHFGRLSPWIYLTDARKAFLLWNLRYCQVSVRLLAPSLVSVFREYRLFSHYWVMLCSCEKLIVQSKDNSRLQFLWQMRNTCGECDQRVGNVNGYISLCTNFRMISDIWNPHPKKSRPITAGFLIARYHFSRQYLMPNRSDSAHFEIDSVYCE